MFQVDYDESVEEYFSRVWGREKRSFITTKDNVLEGI
jgi:hypothetical protein